MKAETAIYIAFDDYSAHDTAEPEKNLMRAILRTAMEDIRKRGDTYREARRYLMANDDFYLYSFVSICHHLKLCPQTVRVVLGIAESSNEQRLAA